MDNTNFIKIKIEGLPGSPGTETQAPSVAGLVGSLVRELGLTGRNKDDRSLGRCKPWHSQLNK